MRALVLALAGLFVFGCSSGDDDMEPVDASVADIGTPEDAGARSVCTMLEAPECTTFETCGDVVDGRCGGCFDFSTAACTFGACEQPVLLSSGNPVNVAFTVAGALAPRVKSFATVAVTAETAGGAAVSCAEVYAGDVDLASGCYNLVDSRGFNASVIGQAYTVFFSRLPTERKILLLIRGYEEDLNSMTEPIGISCTELDVGGPDGSGIDVEGDMMRPIQ